MARVGRGKLPPELVRSAACTARRDMILHRQKAWTLESEGVYGETRHAVTQP
jgi:hypothetical protein